MKRIVTLLFLLVQIALPAFCADDLFLRTSTDGGITACGDAITFTIEIKNTGSNILTGISVKSDMPDGIEFIPGTETGGTYLTSADLTFPEFTIAEDLSPGTTKIVTYQAKANCNLVAYLKAHPPASGNLVYNQTSASYHIGTGSATYNFIEQHGTEKYGSESYNALFPELEILVVSGQNITTTNRQTHTRTIKITNTGAGSIKGGIGNGFTFLINNSSGLDFLSATASIGNFAPVVSSGSVSVSLYEFSSITGGNSDGDNYFETNESITITETVQVTGCPGTIQTIYYGRWGCGGVECNANDQDSRADASIVVQDGDPNMEVSKANNFVMNYCGEREVQLSFKNKGTGTNYAEADRAVDLNLVLQEGYSGQNIVTYYNFKIRVNNGTSFSFQDIATRGITATKTASNIWTLSFGAMDPDGAGGMENLDDDDLFDDLARDQEIVLSFTANVICPDFFNSPEMSYNFDLYKFYTECEDACGNPFTDFNPLTGNTKNILSTQKITGPTDLVNGGEPQLYTFEVSRTYDGAALSCPSDLYYSDITLPVGYAVDGVVLWKKNGQPDQQVAYQQNGNILHLTGGGMSGRYEIKFVLNCNGATAPSAMQDIVWDMYYKCGSCSCAQRLAHQSYQVYNHCPLCEGWHTTEFSVKRKTYGWPESAVGFYTENTLKEVPRYDEETPHWIMDVLRLNAGMETDIIEAVAKGKLTQGTYNNSHVEIRYTSPIPLNVLEYQSGYFLINDTRYNLPSIPGYVQAVSTTGNEFVFNFDVASCEGNHPVSFTTGDNVHIYVRFKITKSTVIPEGEYLLENFRARHYGIDASNQVQSCESFGAPFYLVKYIFKSTVGTSLRYYSNPECSDNQRAVAFAGPFPYPATDPFPYEFRPMTYMGDITLDVPEGFEYPANTAEIRFVMPNGAPYYIPLPIPEVLPNKRLWRKTKDTPIFDMGNSEIVFVAHSVPVCSHNISNVTSINVNYVLYNYYYVSPEPTPTVAGNYFYRNQPNLSVSAIENQSGIAKNVIWPVFLKNAPITDNIRRTIESQYTWVEFVPPSDNINLIQVLDANGNPYTDPYGTPAQIVSYDPQHPERKLIKLGRLKVSSSNVEVRLVAEYTNCLEDMVETITLRSAASCKEYPQNPAQPECSTPVQTINLTLTYKTAALDWIVEKVQPASDFCKPVTFTFDIFDDKIANMYDVELFVQLPDGVSAPFNAQYEYPKGSGNWQPLTGLQTTSKGTGWLLSNLPSLQTLPGTNVTSPVNANHLNIKFDLGTYCGDDPEKRFDPGVPVRFDLFGNTNCKEPIARSAQKKINLQGVTTDKLEVILTVGELSTCFPSIPVSLSVKNIGSDDSHSDIAEIILPKGVKYAGEVSPSLEIISKENGETVLRWKLDPLAHDESWDVEVNVFVESSVPDDTEVILKGLCSMPLQVTCSSSGQVCDIRASERDEEKRTITTKPVVPEIKIGTCEDLPVILNQPVSLTVVNPLAGASFEWDFNQDNIADLITNSPSVNYIFDKEGPLKVKVTMRAGTCVLASAYKDINVVKVSLVSTAITICVGQEAKLYAVPSGLPVTDYVWYRNGVALTNTGDIICITEGGTYKVIVKSLSCVPDPSYYTSGQPLPPGYYFAEAQVIVTTMECGTSLSCDKCMSKFVPEPGKRYILTAWVKEDVSGFVENYTRAGIQLDFHSKGADGKVSPNNTPETVRVKTDEPIIDGWQRIEYEFTTPANAVGVSMTLLQSPEVDIYYDDIRVHPYDGNMKSFVYDPFTLRLMAVLDENNYATFYEYDQEGKLVRIKKETERGIVTIQESGNNIYKTDK